MTTFEFRYDRWCGWILGLFGSGRRFSRVVVDDASIDVRLGIAFRGRVDRSAVTGIRPWHGRVLGWGAHGWRGKWLVNGSSKDIVDLLQAECDAANVEIRVRTSVEIGVRPPTVVYSPSCNTRSRRVCASIGISPISSRNSVPPLACSNRPAERLLAPVNAPFSCPNNSDSISSRGIAAMLMATKGPDLRLPNWCNALATNSLPVPDSPLIMTVRSVCVMRAMTR